jgi:hypothetical protein
MIVPYINSKMKRTIICISFLLSIFAVQSVNAQDDRSSLIDSIQPHHRLGFFIQALLLPAADIKTNTGNYMLHSHHNGSFSGAFVYQLNLDDRWSMDYGLEFIVVSTNYYEHIPDPDLPGNYPSEGAPQIWDKEAFFKVSLPILASYSFLSGRKSFLAAHAGIKLNYSGPSPDMIVGGSIVDSSGRFTSLYSINYKSNNNGMIWVSYVARLSKTFILKNRGLISFGLTGELSTTKFITGDFQITIPNKPITKGEYSIKGSGVGITVQYLFSGRKT